MKFKKKNWKKRRIEEINTSWWSKKKKKWIRGVSFVDWKSFKTNKRVILFCRELMSRNRNLNQCKSSSLLEAGRYFNVEVENYYFCQFTILIPFLSFR